MKQLLLSSLVFLMVTIPSVAITPEQLEQAQETLDQMESKIYVLTRYIRQAYDGVVEGVTLTAGQKQELKDKYSTEKSELADLYNQLP